MHNLAHRPRRTAAVPAAPRPHLSATFAARPARSSDAVDVHMLVEMFTRDGELLPRSLEQIQQAMDDYVVVVDGHDRVLACAALAEYSPSLGEVGSVAVHPDYQGRGLGTIAVRGAEAIARRRGIDELFAVSNASGFFESLGYARTPLTRYPEKLARYARSGRGAASMRKPCFRKNAA
ncbi:MAG: GNAT family N-acetyltransferase [Gemmatimonadaceae bacterium]